MQNFEKISPRTSSVVMRPVMKPREVRAARRSSARRSEGMPRSRPSETAEREAADSRSAAAWRALVTSVPVAEATPARAARAARSSSSPAPCLAEMRRTDSSLRSE